MKSLNKDWRNHRQEAFDLFYRFHCETGDYNADVVVERHMSDKENADFEKRCTLAFFHGATYAAPCEIIFAENFPTLTPKTLNEASRFFRANKNRLHFSGDCKYRKLVFPEFLQSVGVSLTPFQTLGTLVQHFTGKGTPGINYLKLKQYCQGDWYHWGRMGHWCFSEALRILADVKIDSAGMELEEADSPRAGWAFVIGRDDLAEGPLNIKDRRYLERTAADYLQKCRFKNANVFSLETACCNFKRQFKGSRYAGCYFDLQWDESEDMRQKFPEYEPLRKSFMQSRAAIFPNSLLYEFSPDFRNNAPAFDSSWNKTMKDYGRMPRVEAYYAGEAQRWGRLEQAFPELKKGTVKLCD